MASVVQKNFRIRNSFGQIEQVIDIPNLIDIQKQSYVQFLQMNVPADERETLVFRAFSRAFSQLKISMRRALLSSCRITSSDRNTMSWSVHQRGMTFAASLKVVIRLGRLGQGRRRRCSASIRDVKEQEVYFGEIPLQTDEGTFIVNGTERVIVSQLASFAWRILRPRPREDALVWQAALQRPVIPYRGSWLDFEFDAKDILHVRIDRRRKLPATVLLRALGYFQTDELLSEFYQRETIHLGVKADVYLSRA